MKPKGHFVKIVTRKKKRKKKEHKITTLIHFKVHSQGKKIRNKTDHIITFKIHTWKKMRKSIHNKNMPSLYVHM
jgi:hypothetical protein